MTTVDYERVMHASVEQLEQLATAAYDVASRDPNGTPDEPGMALLMARFIAAQARIVGQRPEYDRLAAADAVVMGHALAVAGRAMLNYLAAQEAAQR